MQKSLVQIGESELRYTNGLATHHFSFFNENNNTIIKKVYVNEYGDQGYVYFDNNDELLSIDMSSLEHVEGYLYISGHDVLSDIGLTSSLTAVDDYLYTVSYTHLTLPTILLL